MSKKEDRAAIQAAMEAYRGEVELLPDEVEVGHPNDSRFHFGGKQFLTLKEDVGQRAAKRLFNRKEKYYLRNRPGRLSDMFQRQIQERLAKKIKRLTKIKKTNAFQRLERLTNP